MRSVVTGAPGVDVQPLRQVVLGAGLECSAADCVVWKDLAVRLAQQDTDLVIVKVDENRAADWTALRQAMALTSAPTIAVGPDDGESLTLARRMGLADYVDERHLRDALDALLDRMTEGGALPRRRGNVISVLAPAAGSGGSTVAVNLAGALARTYPREVALVEFAREAGDAALLLDVTPRHTVDEACARWERLDGMSLDRCFTEHSSGLRLLPSPTGGVQSGLLHRDSVRRIAMLARVQFALTVLALDSRLAEEEIEVMRISDSVVLVVRPDVPAVRRARRAIDRVVEEGVPRERLHLVVNRCGQPGQLKPLQIEAALELKVAQRVSDDPKRVNRAANQGALVHELAPGAAISRQLTNLARACNGGGRKASRWWPWRR